MDIQVGDKVKLKSGGPDMTVHDKPEEGDYVRCAYFDEKGECHCKTFNIHSLIKA